MSMNHAILVGNVGRDPDIRTTQSGDRIANFSVATSESWKDKATSERKEAVEWHNIVIYNQSLVDIAERYVKKGGRVGVSGMIKSRKYTDKDGIERRVTDIVIGRFKGELNLLGQPQGSGTRDEHGYGEQRTRDSGQGGGNGYSDAKSGRTASNIVQGKGGAGQSEPRGDLDDDIPF